LMEVPRYGLHVMGEHWLDNLDDLTDLGRLVNQAKDHDDDAACERLCRLIGEFVVGRPGLNSHPSRSGDAVIVAAVPPNPLVRDHLAPHLATAVATALGHHHDSDLIIRRHPTARLRDTEPSRRRATASLAGYEVTRPLEGATVILVDDVIMTGTTVGFIVEILVKAGAGRTEVVVASRTRRRQP